MSSSWFPELHCQEPVWTVNISSFIHCETCWRVTEVTLLSGVINHLHLKWINSRLASGAVIRFHGQGATRLARSCVQQNATKALSRGGKVWGLVMKVAGENSYWSFRGEQEGPGDKVGLLKLAINTNFNPSWRNKHQLPVTRHNCVG